MRREQEEREAEENLVRNKDLYHDPHVSEKTKASGGEGQEGTGTT